MKNCKICSKRLVGRSDKLFCSLKCKNYYHTDLRRKTALVAKDIDKMLHRNRSIIYELLGSKNHFVKIKRVELDKKKFHFNYYTHQNTNKEGRVYNWLYDIGWFEYSTEEMFLLKKY
ncbi:hypothetical protein DIT68_04770 [Brumimicrobium oceani]|uniref:DUF2116 family Zn-ribbon domain-containing protein n=1 Tax=Brumimicrobium oceani TaxID=2100725 RepID=A0A2U2XFL3_9FLAO|nr:hypothetical protein DIT68_04770 [Brumimicrobium oceani]